MSEPSSITEVVRQWVDKAENDLRNASHTLELEEDCPFDTACFHAQQCAEKYLKALLTATGTDPPRTHDLGELVALLPEERRCDLPDDDLDALTPHAVETRYPGPWEPVGREEAEWAVGVARRVRELVRQQLPDEAI